MSLRKNPKIDSAASSNIQKQPEDWVSGQEPMTGAQASYLKTLSEEACEPEAYDDTLTKAEASIRIDALRTKLEKERNAGANRPG
jgi:transposase-like protein